MEFKTDYHIHSNYSDGTFSIPELIKKFKNEGYDEISITDHDGMEGVREAIQLGKDYKIQVISGVEFSTVYNGTELHLLGYKFDLENTSIVQKCAELKAARHDRNVRLLAKLEELGYKLDMAELESMSKGAYVGKPNIARMLVSKGYAADYDEVFNSEKFFEHPEIKAIKKQKMDTTEAIRLVNEAGGLAVLAHPGKIKGLGKTDSAEFKAAFETAVLELKRAGLKGLEVWYSSHTEDEVNYFGMVAAKYHLHMTTGSDFHGEDIVPAYTVKREYVR